MHTRGIHVINSLLFFSCYSIFYYRGVSTKNLERYIQCHKAKTGSSPLLHTKCIEALDKCLLSAWDDMTEKGDRLACGRLHISAEGACNFSL